MRILLIGGTGLISTAITRLLLEWGADDLTLYNRGKTEVRIPYICLANIAPTKVGLSSRSPTLAFLHLMPIGRPPKMARSAASFTPTFRRYFGVQPMPKASVDRLGPIIACCQPI